MKTVWMIAGLVAMTAATLTWTIGFRVAAVSFAGSFPTTTLALLMGVGGYLMTDPRRRRWSWILVAISLVTGPLLRGAWVYFIQGPLELGLLSLLLAGIAALMHASRRRAAVREARGDTSE